MSTINGRACVVNGTPVYKVFSNGRQVYGRNLLIVRPDTVILGTFLAWINGMPGKAGSSPDRAAITYYVPVTAGEQYTISADWKRVSDMEVFGYADTTSNATQIFGDVGNISQTWTTPSSTGHRITNNATTTIPTGVNYLRIGCTGFVGVTTVTLQDVIDAKIKVERGNKATDWSPAPEDVM